MIASGSEPARLTNRWWATFSFHPPGAPAVGRDVYVLEDVVAICGASLSEIAPGFTVTRTEGQGPVPPAGSTSSLVGTTQHLQYTSEEQQRELLQISNPGARPIAVVIPIRKTEAWWSLPQDRRQAHYRAAGEHAGHTAIGTAYAARIYRRLFHARYLPGSSFDFITYFEMEERHVADFRSLLAELRDPRRNPEWAFVDREIELWMRRP